MNAEQLKEWLEKPFTLRSQRSFEDITNDSPTQIFCWRSIDISSYMSHCLRIVNDFSIPSQSDSNFLSQWAK